MFLSQIKNRQSFFLKLTVYKSNIDCSILSQHGINKLALGGLRKVDKTQEVCPWLKPPKFGLGRERRGKAKSHSELNFSLGNAREERT
jgi:hypothetical protein